jgi:hypothetical protein
MSGPFSYVAWLPEGYPSNLPCWGARLIVQGWSSVLWVGDRTTYRGPRVWGDPVDDAGTAHWDYDQSGYQEWMHRAGSVIDEAYTLLNSGDIDLSTQPPDVRCFQIAATGNGITVWYCCIHGYCHMVATESVFTATAIRIEINN